MPNSITFFKTMKCSIFQFFIFLDAALVSHCGGLHTGVSSIAFKVAQQKDDDTAMANISTKSMERALGQNMRGDLRLILNGKQSSSKGILQVYYNSKWGSVCDDDFTNTNAIVACRQLGFKGGYAVGRAGLGQGIGPIWLDNVICSGTEQRLVDCMNDGWGEENCGHHEDVGLVCSDESFSEGDLQLVNGNQPNEGRLQIFHDGVWGIVCDDDITNAAANVACQELGYAGGYGSSNGVLYGEGVDPTWLDGVVCLGTEERFIDCMHDGWGEENCGHSEDVGLSCSDKTFSEGDIQLVGGNGPHEGRLQVYHDGIWGTVCDDDFTNAGSNVVCKQLGYVGGYGSSEGTYTYGRGIDPTWLDGVECIGNEKRITECQHPGWGEENCGHNEDVIIFCSNEIFSEGDIQLVNGTGPHEGRLQLYHDGIWGTVCDDDFTNTNANVVCQQLGYVGGYGSSQATFTYGQGTDPIWLDGVECMGNEKRITDCSHPGWGEENCGHSEDIGIFCSNDVFSEGDIQLVNGTGPHEGRLQVYHDGIWGTVCDDDFTTVSANVACRQLGYHGGFKFSETHKFGHGVDPIWLDSVVCIGNEERISDCPNPGWGEENCGHSEDVSISCFPKDVSSREFSDGDIVLASRDRPNEGKILIYHENQWGGICRDGLTQATIDVICRELGYNQGGEPGSSTFAGDIDTIWLKDVNCAGNERRVMDCNDVVWGAGNNNNCGWAASVTCYQNDFPDAPDNIKGSSDSKQERPILVSAIIMLGTTVYMLWML